MAGVDLMVDRFSVGYYDLHPERSINFQLNRWITYLGPSALEDMRAIAPRLQDYPSYCREFLALAQKALAEGRKLHAAYYLRSAEFFMAPDDPQRPAARRQFLELVWQHYGLKPADRLAIPYHDSQVNGFLPAYHFSPDQPRGTIVVHGGFDSYIEEFFPVLLSVRDMGYQVVCFDGPGQGGALQDYGLHLTHEWHKPVRAVLDHFALDNVTLLGISMGGCLALRAAAFEPRVRRVVAYDVFYDWLDTTLSKFPGGARLLIRTLLNLRAAGAFNAVLGKVTQQSLLLEWAMGQAMHVLGVQTAYEVYQLSKRYTTRDVSPLVKQDVLLLAGAEDHIVPLHQYRQQREALRNARSLTGRLFTQEEQAQNHCQIGNIGLALSVILEWIRHTETG